MEHIDSESASDVMRWLQSEAAVLWPAFLGSLSLRRSRCVRANCAACLSGKQHLSYVLYDRAEGASHCGLRSGRTYSASAARAGQRPRSAGFHAPTIPPVAAPAAAPTAVAASQPAATTGPRPGIASKPRPASRPAAPHNRCVRIILPHGRNC